MALTNGQFHFKLEAATVDETNAQLTGNANIPMPGNAADNVNNCLLYTSQKNGQRRIIH